MADEYREVTTTSWGKRIAGSFIGVIIGLVLFLGAFALIWWNEGRSVDRIKTLAEGRSAVVSVSAERVDAGHHGKLVHLSGMAATDEVLKDLPFGVRENALKLKRTVEMYQWKEEKKTEKKKNLGGSETEEVTYTYDKTWSEEPIDSTAFKISEGHQNPSSMPYRSQVLTASAVRVGAFRLTDAFVSQINEFAVYPLSPQTYAAMDGSLRRSFKLNGAEYFHGDPANLQVGALRIRYAVVKPMTVSIVGRQENDTIGTYRTRNGNIMLLTSGTVDSETMFASAESENTVVTWLVRLGGAIMMWLGLVLMLGPLKVLGDVVPLVGSMVGAGAGLLAGVAAVALSVATIALAWVFYRPLIGVALLILAGVFFLGGVRLLKKKAA